MNRVYLEFRYIGSDYGRLTRYIIGWMMLAYSAVIKSAFQAFRARDLDMYDQYGEDHRDS